MKKALLGQEEVFLWKQKGRIGFWDFDIEEILNAADDALENDLKTNCPGIRSCQEYATGSYAILEKA